MWEHGAPIFRNGQMLILTWDDGNSNGAKWTVEVHAGSHNGTVLHSEEGPDQNDARKRCVDWINQTFGQ